MAKEDNFIVAIELGSSKVTALAGRKQPDGAIQVLACAQEPAENFIRKGRINNVNKMTQCITNIKEKLEKKLQKRISHVYVGIGGMGMHTVPNKVLRDFPAKTIVTSEIIERMADTNLAASTPEREILSVIPQEYKLGTQQLLDPVGVQTESIEGHFLNIVANSSICEDINNCFRQAGIGIAGMPITVLSLANAMLSESEKRSGCVFVDMGAETTCVSVYKNNLLRHMAVIPLGGANINRDIASLQIEDAEAERLKLTYGTAYSNSSDEEQPAIKLEDGRIISHDELCGLIESRMEEIIRNVENQIQLSKYNSSQLIAGIMVTGGAAKMPNIEKAFNEYTNFSKLRPLAKTRLQARTNIADFNADGSYNAVLSIIDEAEINCCGGEIGDKQNDLFLEQERQRKAEEAARKAEEEKAAAEEAERLRLEEEERQRQEEEKQRKRAKRNRFFKSMKDFLNNLVNEEDENKVIQQSDKKDENEDNK